MMIGSGGGRGGKKKTKTTTTHEVIFTFGFISIVLGFHLIIQSLYLTKSSFIITPITNIFNNKDNKNNNVITIIDDNINSQPHGFEVPTTLPDKNNNNKRYHHHEQQQSKELTGRQDKQQYKAKTKVEAEEHKQNEKTQQSHLVTLTVVESSTISKDDSHNNRPPYQKEEIMSSSSSVSVSVPVSVKKIEINDDNNDDNDDGSMIMTEKIHDDNNIETTTTTTENNNDHQATSTTTITTTTTNTTSTTSHTDDVFKNNIDHHPLVEWRKNTIQNQQQQQQQQTLQQHSSPTPIPRPPPKLQVVVWPMIEFGLKTPEDMHIYQDGIQQSQYLELVLSSSSSVLWNTTTTNNNNNNNNNIVWIGDSSMKLKIRDGSSTSKFCKQFGEFVIAASSPSSSKIINNQSSSSSSFSSSWSPPSPPSPMIYITDFSDSHILTRCSNTDMNMIEPQSPTSLPTTTTTTKQLSIRCNNSNKTQCKFKKQRQQQQKRQKSKSTTTELSTTIFDNVYYSTRSIVEKRIWDQKLNWVDIGKIVNMNVSKYPPKYLNRKKKKAAKKKNYHNMDDGAVETSPPSLYFQHTPLIVRTDTIVLLKQVLDETFNVSNLSDPIESMLPRPIDVTHFWPPNRTVEQSVGYIASNLRYEVSDIIVQMSHSNNNNITAFVDVVGWAGKGGRNNVKAQYIERMLETKIVVISQRDKWEDHYRLMEGLISGAMIMTDRMLSLPPGLRNGTSIIEYTSCDDLQYKLQYYLTNEKERIQIAMQGRYVAMSMHRSWHRLESIIFGQTVTQCDKQINPNCPYIVHAKEGYDEFH